MIALADYLRLVLINFKSKKLRSWLTIIGIVIGITAVVALIGLGEGLRNAITAQFGALGADVLTVQASGLEFAGPPGTGVSFPLSDKLAGKIKRISGVEAAINRYIDTAKVEFRDRQEIKYMTSIPEGENRKITEQMLNIKTTEGRLLKDGDRKKALLGSNYADTYTFGKRVSVGNTIILNGEEFSVIGIMEKKGSFVFDDVIWLNEKELLTFKDNTEVNAIAVKVKDEKQIGAVKRNVESLLRKERDVKEGEENFIVQTPEKIHESLDSTLFAVQLFVYIIAAISLLVGGIGIMNTMYTSVIERTKQIGVMKSIGAANSSIFMFFFIESGVLGLAGGTIGALLGLGIAYSLAFLGRIAIGVELIQAHVSFALIGGALAFSFIVGTIAGLFPARQASKLQPVEALRFK